MFSIPKSDALDVLLFGIGLRITQLAKMGDPKFKSLLDNRNFTIQMGSEAQDIYRTFSVENGRFTQQEGKTDKPTLSIDFKDSMTGAKLLTKGDATAFMMGIQNGEVKMSGDYSLLMWFNQIAKHIIPKIPEHLQPAVEAAKPFITKATPVAKELCDKGMALLAGFGLFGLGKSQNSDSKSNQDKESAKKDDSDSKEKDSATDSTTKDKEADEAKSLVDTAKEKLADVKADVEDKVEELKEKFDDVKEDAKDKFAEIKDKTDDKVQEVKSEVKDKADTLTGEAKDKLDEVKAKAETTAETVKDKADDLKQDITAKAADVKEDMKDKADIAKDKVDAVKDKADDAKTAVKQTTEDSLNASKDNAAQGASQTQSKFDALKAKLDDDTADNLTPAQQKSHELEEKHAGEKVIADNVKIEAVKDDKSPVTNVTVTRATDTKSS